MRSIKAFAVCLGVFLTAGCVGPDVTDSQYGIIGGDPVQDDELPTVVGLATNAGSVCTGTLISPTAILTAAHCVEPELLKQAIQQAGGTPPDEIEYRFSFARDLLAAEEGDFLAVDSVDWHEQFMQDLTGLFDRPGRWYDIGLLHLAEPVTGHPVQQLATSDAVEALEMGGTHLVTGYGLTDDADSTSAGTLTRGVSGLDERGDYELIAGVGDAQQACRGDSGGPIFADDSATLQVGIASRINAAMFPPPSEPPPCDSGLLYTRVDTYLDWIQERVPDLGDSTDPGDDPGDDNPDDPGGDDPGADNPTGGEETGGCSTGGASGGLASMLIAIAALAALRRREQY